MPIFDLFSKRQRQLRGEVPDIFEYNEIPQHLRVQVIHIWRDAIGEDKSEYSNTVAANLYKEVHDILCREYGLFELVPGSSQSTSWNLSHYFLTSQDNEKVLDVIELVFRAIDIIAREDSHTYSAYIKAKPDDAINELNARF